MGVAKRIGGVGSKARFYDLDEDQPLVRTGTVEDISTVGLAVRTDDGMLHMVAFALFIDFVED